MIHVKCFLLVGTAIVLCNCKPGKTELGLARFSKKEAAKYNEYPATVILKEQNIRMTATRYALSTLPEIDSTILTEVYIPIPGTNGKFSMFSVQRGEQYNIMLPGNKIGTKWG